MHIRKIVFGSYVLALLFYAPAAMAEDGRELVALPGPVKERFLTEMRSNLVKLEDMLAALGEGDFTEVANIADLKMGFGHGQMEQMEKAGKNTQQMLARKKEMRALGHGSGHGKNQGQGMGRYMPEAFRLMGQNMHQTSEDLALEARRVGQTPTVKDYQTVIRALEDVSSACTSCHEVYRVN